MATLLADAVVTASAPSGEGPEALVRSLRAELDLLGELGDRLVEQRAALAADDTAALEQILQQIGRTLLTIREARRERLVLVEMMTGSRTTALAELGNLMPPADAAAFADLARRLHAAAVAAGRELAINQLAIRRAIEAGERFLHALLTVPAAGEGEPAGGLLLNERA